MPDEESLILKLGLPAAVKAQQSSSWEASEWASPGRAMHGCVRPRTVWVGCPTGCIQSFADFSVKNRTPRLRNPPKVTQLVESRAGH